MTIQKDIKISIPRVYRKSCRAAAPDRDGHAGSEWRPEEHGSQGGRVKPGSIRYFLLLALLVTLPVPIPLAAQLSSSPRELGMGGAYLGVARGHEALFLAPGNLALHDAPSWSVGIPQFSAGGTLLGVPLKRLRGFADYDELEMLERRDLLELIPSTGTEGTFAIRAPLAAFSSGPFALGIAYVGQGRHRLSRDVAELLLDGYEEGRSDYRIGDTSGERLSYWDLALGYGFEIGGLSLGITGHHLRRGTLVRTRLQEPQIDLHARTFEMEYHGVNAKGGTGYSFDVGAAYPVTPTLTISAALSNLFSRMSWPSEIGVRTLTLDREALADHSPRSLSSQYRESEIREEAGSISGPAELLVAGLHDAAQPPGIARLGLAWAPAAGTRIAADLHRTFVNGRLGDEWDRRLSFGIQQEYSFLVLRGGTALANDGGRMISGGLSLGPLDLGVARLHLDRQDGLRSSGWLATFGISASQP